MHTQHTLVVRQEQEPVGSEGMEPHHLEGGPGQDKGVAHHSQVGTGNSGTSWGGGGREALLQSGCEQCSSCLYLINANHPDGDSAPCHATTHHPNWHHHTAHLRQN
ncbi:uncharacterized protein LOC123507151 [Portunus trituberculatus]|uniref:uncharacterized protein LOC123507151 n=1 Tax=Portunus trituberculatus TaxID=210409 RepID=UPI001E1D15B1|nr:uncharacterized protein LOC123507151 [Portunus trituberculatus]